MIGSRAATDIIGNNGHWSGLRQVHKMGQNFRIFWGSYEIPCILYYILHLMYQDIIHLSKTLQHTCIGFGCSFAAQVEGEGPEKEQLAKFFACADAWHARAVQAGDRSDLRCFWVYY